MAWNKVLIRNLVAFWLFGLCNNYGYVIMLSAAEDIMNNIKDTKGDNTSLICETHISSRHCSAKSTGAVLLADNLPSLICKLTFPFFMHRIPFGFRHALVCVLQASSYFIVAFSGSVAQSLAGVALGSVGSGVGEITYLGLSSFFPASMIAAWSSGTGGAGLVGSFSYAFLTEPSIGGLTPKVALLIQTFIPVVFAIAYWLILDAPQDVYTPGFNPKSWIVPLPEDQQQIIARSNTSASNEAASGWEKDCESMDDEQEPSENLKPVASGRVPQRKLNFVDRVQLILPILHLMIPVALVYIGEYLINQGLTQLIFFNCHNGWGLTRHSQYRWFQVLYQFGVFLSRSSVKLFELPQWSLYLLPLLQFANAIFFFFEAVYWFVPNIGIIFALIIFEGLLGGASYVNTFNRIHKRVPADVREYSLSIATVGDSIGVNIAGFTAIPLYNWVCGMKMPNRNL